jgi:hypothetical protein
LNQRQTAARQFLSCVRGLQRWDLVSLRETWRLPAEVPLEALADLVARVEHLDRKSTEGIDRAIRRSRAYPWIESSGQFAEIRNLLPAAWAYLAANERVRGRPSEIPRADRA